MPPESTGAPSDRHLPHSAAEGGVGIRLMRLSKSFGPVDAVGEMSLAIHPGEFVAILGPSGCGKSTLLRIIAGLDRPSGGEILIDGPARPAFVFQDAHLLPWRRVLRNVTLPLELRGAPRAARETKARQAIDSVGLSDAIHRFPAQLSGGMRMRGSLARALVTDPNLLLLDEPFAALDEITRATLDIQLRRLWIERRMTILFVTHSITEAAFLADRAIVLSARPARIVLDTPIALGTERNNELRGEAAFARQTRILLDALENGRG